MIFNSFLKAVSQFGDRRFRGVVLVGVVLALAVLVAITAGFLAGIQYFVGDKTEVWLIGEVRWLDDLLRWSSLFIMIILSVFLMVPVASAITSMFLDDVAQAVEDRHYPNLAPAPRVPFWNALRDTVNFLGVIVGANALALVVYAAFTPLAIFIFWALNGYLLGMEYFQLAAMRRLGRTKARELRKIHRRTIWGAGVFMAIPLSIPLVNLLIPALGAATFTHIFQSVSAKTEH